MKLKEIVASTSFRSAVERARKRLDLKDQGWNEAIREAAAIAKKWRGSREGLVALLMDRLIPDAPSPRRCPICKGRGEHPSPAAQAIIPCTDCCGTGEATP